MNHRYFFGLIFVVMIVAIAIPQSVQCAEKDKPVSTKYAAVEKEVLDYFKSLPDYKSSSIIYEEQVEQLFSELKRKGLEPAESKSILKKLLPKDDFLVKELDTPAGRKFCERIKVYALAFDRLDRLRQLEGGKQTVRDLVHGTGGEKMMEYFTTSGGKELGKMLSKAPNGTDFNKPTGKIYIVAQLLEQLKGQYPSEEKKK